MKEVVKAMVFAVLIGTFLIASVGYASATIYYVNPGDSIQNAVAMANPGDTIIVRDGTYVENVDINKSLTIQAENGSANCIVQAADPYDLVFKIAADYVNISGFMVKGSIVSGIRIYGANFCNILNNTCSYNYFDIDLWYSNNNSISNNTCLSYFCGIILVGSNSNDILNNTCYNKNGIYLKESNNSSISNNTCSNSEVCIYLEKSNNNTISNNTCSNSNYCIYLDDSSNNCVSTNTCSNNSVGIYLKQSNNNSISKNTYSNNWYCAMLLYSNDLIYLNNFINNTYNVYSLNSTNTWSSPSKITYTYNGSTHTNYMGNYWSDYKGADADGDGIGDTPYIMDSDKDNYPLMEPWEIYFKPSEEKIFDTGQPQNPYPSIFGTHNGTIKPNQTITVSKLYTYPCEGTGGHTEHVRIWNSSWDGTEAHWNGYTSDWHNITFGVPFTLKANEEYNYTIITGSYPQIHHTKALLTANGWINCTEFIDANGKRYYNWIPAIRLG